MIMDTRVIREMCAQLDEAKNQHAIAVESRKVLDFGGHQDVVKVVIGKTSIDVSYLGRETGWASTVIRGREMIVLGMQKVANANVEFLANKILSIQAAIAKATGGQS